MSADFVSNISKWLEQCQYQQVKSVVLDRKNSQIVRENGMEIILAVCNHLNSEKTPWSSELEQCCEFTLLMVAQLSNPKEVLIALQEQVELFGSSSKFKILLLPFQAVLLQLPDRQSNILNLVLETIGHHIRMLPLPESSGFEGRERMLLDADPRVQCISDIYEAVAEFYNPFVKEVSLTRTQTKSQEVCVEEKRRVLRENLLKIMGEPLVYMDLHVSEKDAPSLLRRMAEKLIHHLSLVTSDIFLLMAALDEAQEDCSLVSEDDKPWPSPISVSNILYLVYGEQIACNSLPCVYSQEFVFHSVLPYSNLLLKSNNELAIHKGLLLLKAILQRVDDMALTIHYLDHPAHLKVLSTLSAISVTCPVREFRILAVELFRPYVQKWDMSGRYHLLRSILTILDHSGIRGLVVTIIKDQIAVCLEHGWPYFLQEQLRDIYPLIWNLPNGTETDLLEHMDYIMSALNLARYLLIRDRDNRTGFLDHRKGFQSQYLECLSRGLKISRAHYELELKKLKAGNTADLSNLLPLPQLPRDKQKTVFETALNSFDLLQSVLARVFECLH